MKHVIAATILSATLLAPSAAFAGERTVTLTMPDLAGCPSCAFIIKRVISSVDGVTQVKTAAADLTATVTFDDAVTTVNAIVQAAAGYGYEATPLGAVKGS